jgi:hypothetical protein
VRARIAVAAVAALAAAALFGPAGPASSGTLPFTATLSATSHTPRVGTAWWYEITVLGPTGNPLPSIAKVFVYQGSSKINTVGFFRFKGRLLKKFRWQSFLRGAHLVLVAQVQSGTAQTKLGYAVRPT